MKLKKRKKKNVWEEVSETIEAFRNNPDYAPDPEHVQIYITTKDGGIVELHIGYDGEKILKTFDSFDSEDDLEEQRIIERMEDPEEEILLN